MPYRTTKWKRYQTRQPDYQIQTLKLPVPRDDEENPAFDAYKEQFIKMTANLDRLREGWIDKMPAKDPINYDESPIRSVEWRPW